MSFNLIPSFFSSLGTVMLWIVVFCLLGSAIVANDDIFTSLKSLFKSRGLRILHQNIRALMRKLPTLQLFLQDHKQTDIFTLSETHISFSTTESINYEISGYDFFSRHREKRLGGGFYVKEEITWKRRMDFLQEGNSTFSNTQNHCLLFIIKGHRTHQYT